MERDFMGLNPKVKEEAADGFEAFNNHQPAEIQNAQFLQLHHDTKPAVSASMSSPFFGHHLAGGNASVNPQLFSGVPFMPRHLILPSTTEPWFSSKAASVPAAQLTIFYGGMVNVYDDISPQKAEAIMLLAGKGAFNGPQLRGQATGDLNHAQPCPAVSSPMSVSSHPVANEYGASTTPLTKLETSRVMSSFTQARQSAVPQARKASLARFLEKRKERLMAASVPYYLNKSSSIAVIAGSKQRV